MAKIAQQDDLVIEITGAFTDITTAQKKKLTECVHANTILDVIIKTTTEGTSKVIAYTVTDSKITIVAVDSSAATVALEKIVIWEA